ncbi:Rossmann-like domain-containing protein [Reinekea marinisedimentorum]|uniref:Putative heavy-metal chelation protein n=1 Tax=Reinekea marinisedimentorum TaxID=230495 RepID=A0A4R3I875_9GAMM|nr:DUF364 domain-containing protein [Reinekea marinisedimentorum]TCS40377.1 putative heavy-metal chelation protein [Reinekea marinisedimentorum]
MDLLIQAKEKLIKLLQQQAIREISIQVSARGLTPEEAIGLPGRTDYPIMNGKEVMIEANCDGAFGQAFTDAPAFFNGTLTEVLQMPLEKTSDRALLVATLNAVLRKHQLAEKTVHCKNEEPEQCSQSLMPWLESKLTEGRKIGLIGLQPAMLESLSETFGPQNIMASDLNPNTIGTVKWSVTILDGSCDNERIIEASDFILVTGSSIVNGSFNELYKSLRTKTKSFAAFGNTISGVASLLSIPHVCFYGR